jgi:hypothetical protein
LDGEDIKGTFYPEELQAIGKSQYIIERIISKRKSKEGTNQLKVKWLGWPSMFNSWIPETNLENI